MPETTKPPPRTRSSSPRIERKGHLRWVPIAQMRVNEAAQRTYRETHAREYADNFDLEALGYPVVNHRDGLFYITDGQHRVMALRLIGWEDQQIECECFEDLTEEEEAELFLKRNKRRAVRAFENFLVAVKAGREAECDVNRIVLAQGLKVSEDRTDGSIQAVTALMHTYTHYGASVLAKTLRIARDAYAKDPEGFRGVVLQGLGMVCGQYDGKLDEALATRQLAKVPGGPLGLVGRAQIIKRTAGKAMYACVAAQIVEFVNQGQPTRSRLPSWWKATTKEDEE
jgi:hypothetical protein